MNAQMNGNTGGDPNGAAVLNQYGGGQDFKIFRKHSDITKPGPSSAWVFIDEHTDSINDGLFRVIMQSGTYQWADWPASSHGGSGALSFADGHAETRKWTDPAIANLPVRRTAHSTLTANSPYTDLLWLQERTTALP